MSDVPAGFGPLFRSSPAIDLIGPVYAKGEGADLVLGMRVEQKHCNMRGTLHGGILATLADQDAGQRGLFVDFFGRPASTHKAIALLALEHNVPMVVIGTPKLDGIYQLWATDVIYPEDYQKSPDAIRAITQRITTGLEMLIRQAPEQYFWLHRRWKHAPPVRGKRKALAA